MGIFGLLPGKSVRKLLTDGLTLGCLLFSEKLQSASSEEVEVVIPEVPAAPPSPEPGSMEWVYVDQPIDKVRFNISRMDRNDFTQTTTESSAFLEQLRRKVMFMPLLLNVLGG